MHRLIPALILPIQEILINEALRIKNTEVNVRMNSGSEWRADRIPRASFTAPGLIANDERRTGEDGRRRQERGRRNS